MPLLTKPLTIPPHPGRHTGIQDVEALVRKALNDWLTRHTANLNPTLYDDALKDLVTTVLTELEPRYDPERTNGNMALTTFVYRALRQRYIIQWYRDNIRDTRSGRQCPKCQRGSKQHTRWIGNNERECLHCGLVYPDWTEVSLGDDDRDQHLAGQIDFTELDVQGFAASPRLTPQARVYVQEVVLTRTGAISDDLKPARRQFARTHGYTPVDLFRIETELREQLLLQGHAA